MPVRIPTHECKASAGYRKPKVTSRVSAQSPGAHRSSVAEVKTACRKLSDCRTAKGASFNRLKKPLPDDREGLVHTMTQKQWNPQCIASALGGASLAVGIWGLLGIGRRKGLMERRSKGPGAWLGCLVRGLQVLRGVGRTAGGCLGLEMGGDRPDDVVVRGGSPASGRPAPG